MLSRLLLSGLDDWVDLFDWKLGRAVLDLAQQVLAKRTDLGTEALLLFKGELLAEVEQRFQNFLQLADALLAEELGFGMWRARKDVADAEGYVSDLREAEMRTPDGREKTPEEFLNEIETSDE